MESGRVNIDQVGILDELRTKILQNNTHHKNYSIHTYGRSFDKSDDETDP